MDDTYTYYKRVTPNGIRDNRPITSSTRLILREAEALGMQVEHVEGAQMFRLEHEGRVRHFHFQNPSPNTALSMFLTDSKRRMRNLLTQADIQVSPGYAIHRDDGERDIAEVFESLTKPLVVKPSTGTQGKAITVDVTTRKEFFQAVHHAFTYTKKRDSWVVVEEQLVGYKEYRVLCSRDRVIGVTHRVPANVVGDGKSNIRKLIKDKNADPRRGDPSNHPPLFRIQLDDAMKAYLAAQGMTWKYVPDIGQVVYLRGVSNISQGGDSIDYTDIVHPSVNELCLRAVRAIPGLALGGVDFMSKDITAEQTPDMYAILEINNSPGIDIHDFPYEGANRRAGKAFLEVMFGRSL